MKLLNRLLNNLTMYELVQWGLRVIAAVAVVESFFGLTGYNWIAMLLSMCVLAGTAMAADWILGRLFHSTSAVESAAISGVILSLIMRPAESPIDYAWMVLAAIVAMSSKHLLAIRGKQIFNPAAISLVIIGLAGYDGAYWWVGSRPLFWPVLIVGLLVVHKLRRFHQFLPFLAAAMAATFLRHPDLSLQALIDQTVVSGPLLFMGTIMLTEPSTTPPTRRLRVAYGTLTGVISGLAFTVGPFYNTPHLSLVLGNLFSFAVSFKRRVQLHFQGARQVGAGVYDLTFEPAQSLPYRPGQYLEWTLPHAHPDSRGNRRYFTIASSPTENVIRLGARIDPERASSYKKALLKLKPGDTLSVTNLAGDFVLPQDQSQKLVFIAGGIGITPFRSMVQYMLDSHEHRDVTLFYTAQTADGFAYWELFNQAVSSGIKPVYVITGPDAPEAWHGLTGFLRPGDIKNHVAEYKTAVYYISGPDAMVRSYKRLLRELGIPGSRIKTDYFPGY
jgi:ferredoxin-NADP reductase/Na+-translocating ferredoxin:NAD+ oxidoreductase RnfD subunit